MLFDLFEFDKHEKLSTNPTMNHICVNHMRMGLEDNDNDIMLIF
jgi:hypothetical protein